MKSAEKFDFQPEAFTPITAKQETDVARQQLVINALRNLRKDNVHNLPRIASGLDHDGRNSGYNPDQFEPGLYIEPELSTQVFPEGRTPNRMQFTPAEILRIGKEDSRRQVFFGQIKLGYFDGKQKDSTIPIAVKAFEGQASKQEGLQEMAIAQYLEAVGVDVIPPAGLLVTEAEKDSKTFFLLSIYDPNIKTLDNLDWKEETEEDVAKHLDGAVSAVAEIHSNLIFQGDCELRNIAMRQTQGDYLVVDYERSVSTLNDSNRNRNPIRTAQCMGADLGDITGNVAQAVYKNRYGSGSESEVFEWMLGNVYMPYRQHIIEKDGHFTSLLLSSFGKMIQDKAKQATGEWIGKGNV